jgi:hypothetical protein
MLGYGWANLALERNQLVYVYIILLISSSLSIYFLILSMGKLL